MRSLQISIILGHLLVSVSGFNLPVSPTTLPASRHSTSLGLRRRYRPKEWVSCRKHRLNQSAYTAGRHGYIEDDNVVKRLKRSVGKLKTEKKKEGKAATLASSTMNLVKCILGTGVLALPAGVAAVSNMPIALVPATALMFVLGVFSAYTFQLYGRLAHETQATDMGEIWERTVGKESSWVISAATFSFCFCVALIYALVIGDFLSSLSMSLGSSVPALFTQRQFWILSVTWTTLLPLSSLKSLAALAPMSMLGTVGTLLTTIFMAIRCPAIFPASPYSVAPEAVGKFAAAAAPHLAPKFGSFSKIISPAALIIASMATTAYLGHFNAPALYHGFKEGPNTKDQETEAMLDANATNKDSEKAMIKYGKMTVFGFAGCTLVNIMIMSLGYLTFGGNSAGVILNNYATADKGAVISRLLMTLSVIGGYPFMVGGCKAGFVQLYNSFKKGKRASQDTIEKWVVRGVISIATTLALLVSDAGLVVSLCGALMGSSLIYTFPGIMFLAHTGKQIKAAGGIVSRKMKLERFTCRFLTTFGIVSGLIGAAVSVINSVAPHLLR